jgi:hypothetical protein
LVQPKATALVAGVSQPDRNLGLEAAAAADLDGALLGFTAVIHEHGPAAVRPIQRQHGSLHITVKFCREGT